MTECLPDIPRYIRQRDNEWQGADHQDGPWRPIPAPQSGLPWRTDGPAVPESREPASVATEASPLSSAAQAVLDAVLDETAPLSEQRQQRTDAAAALRAVADQVVPEQKPWHRTGLQGSTRHDVCAEILAIAAELEGADA